MKQYKILVRYRTKSGANAKEVALKSYERDPLIAAAPDLLAALKGLLAQNLALAHEIKSTDPLWCKWWDEARAAIAKAEGRE